MSRREIWQKIYERFDVYEYATPTHWRADREQSPAKKIIEILSRPFASDAPIMSELASPGPLVAANASTSPNEMPARSIVRLSKRGACWR